MDSALPTVRAPARARVVTLHRSRRGVVLLLARVVLLPVCTAVVAQNLATIGSWSIRTWIATVVLGAYIVGAFVELARSFGVAELAVVDGDLVVFAPSLLRAPMRIPGALVIDAHVTPKGWYGYRGRLPYALGETGAITPERPDLGASIRAVVTLSEPLALPWRRLPVPRGDLTRGRSMPRTARHLVLGASERDLEPLRALFAHLDTAASPRPTHDLSASRRDFAVVRTRIAIAACVLVALPLLPHARHDPLGALRPGVCLDAPDTTGTTAIDRVDVEPCSVPHTAEVIGATHNAQASAAGANDCATEYALYAGTSHARTAVRVQVLRRPGSNDGVCIAVTSEPVDYSLHASGTTI